MKANELGAIGAELAAVLEGVIGATLAEAAEVGRRKGSES